MSLEQRVRQQRAVVLRRAPISEVQEAIARGKKFIIVSKEFYQSFIPAGYMFIDMRYKNDSFKTLVPQNLLYFLANPGEGDVDEALNEIGDFYDEVKGFEDELLEGNGESVQGTNWAVTARNAYTTYLINKLTKPNKDNPDSAEWNPEALEALCLTDDYVARRVKAIAAVCLGKTAEQVKHFELGDVLKHVTVNERKVENLTQQEFDEITCWAGSHYEIKDEYRNKPDVDYEIDKVHDQSYKCGKKIMAKQDVAVLDASIDDLEKEIEEYRQKKQGGENIGRHDRMLTRAYANLNYIAREDPGKQLDIFPAGDAK